MTWRQWRRWREQRNVLYIHAVNLRYKKSRGTGQVWKAKFISLLFIQFVYSLHGNEKDVIYKVS